MCRQQGSGGGLSRHAVALSENGPSMHGFSLCSLYAQRRPDLALSVLIVRAWTDFQAQISVLYQAFSKKC